MKVKLMPMSKKVTPKKVMPKPLYVKTGGKKCYK